MDNTHTHTRSLIHSWGECVCSPLRRGAAASMRVRVDQEGPMYALHADSLLHLLSPITKVCCVFFF